jgi:TM2 domain
MNNVSTAYILWLGWLLGLGGLQRLYNGKIFTGMIWLCTWGMFGVGQFVDLVLIPNMVDDHNAKLKASRLTLMADASHQPGIHRLVEPDVVHRPIAPMPSNRLAVRLVKAAGDRGGKISVTQGVMDTDATFVEVETTLRDLAKTGYVEVYNDPDTGVVLYEFREL